MLGLQPRSFGVTPILDVDARARWQVKPPVADRLGAFLGVRLSGHGCTLVDSFSLSGKAACRTALALRCPAHGRPQLV